MMEVIVDGVKFIPLEDAMGMPNLPQTLKQAALMQIIGYRWIEDNAPEKLTDVARQNKERTTELADALEKCMTAFTGTEDWQMGMDEVTDAYDQAKAALKKIGI